MNRALWATVSVVAMSALTACGGSDDGDTTGSAPSESSDAGGSEEPLIIAWLSPDATSSTRWEEQDRPAFEAAVEELAPGSQVIASTVADDLAMLAAAESALTQGAQVLVINPFTSDGAAPIAEMAKREGVEIVAYDGLMTDSEIDGYVSFDNFKVGQLQAQYMVDNLEPGSTIAIMNGAQVCEACIAFKEGAHDVLDPLFESGDLVLGYEADTPDWLASNAQSQTDQALTDLNDEIDGIIAANDGLAGGVIAALKARQLNGKVLVTGQDATLQGLQEILLGNQSMTVYKNLHEEAAAAAAAAVALARGDDDTGLSTTVDNGAMDVPSVLLDPMVVDKENIPDTVIADEFVSREDLCAGEAADACDF